MEDALGQDAYIRLIKTADAERVLVEPGMPTEPVMATHQGASPTSVRADVEVEDEENTWQHQHGTNNVLWSSGPLPGGAVALFRNGPGPESLVRPAAN